MLHKPYCQVPRHLSSYLRVAASSACHLIHAHRQMPRMRSQVYHPAQDHHNDFDTCQNPCAGFKGPQLLQQLHDLLCSDCMFARDMLWRLFGASLLPLILQLWEWVTPTLCTPLDQKHIQLLFNSAQVTFSQHAGPFSRLCARPQQLSAALLHPRMPHVGATPLGA